jgi:D-arabinose 1-dehydrogenase-like Zn-dependent alcohol dehydrogenase
VCGVCRECRSGREATCEQRIFLGDWGLNGGYAEFVSVSEHNVANIPDSVAFADASVAACCIGTSLNAIRDVGQVFLGDRVLVTGASGGLGLHAVQIARAAGAFVVGATSALSKAQIIRDCGAHEVVVFERGADFSASVREACGGHGVDVAIDNIGGPGFHATRRSLRTNGRWILIGQVSRDFVSFSPAQFIHSGISLHPVASCSKTQLEDALALIVQARVRPAISKILPLADASTAHTMMEAGEVTGRLVLSPNPSLLNA